MTVKRITMQIISEAHLRDRAIVVMTSANPLVKSSGTLTYVCACCETVILQGVNRKQFAGLVVKCGGCASINMVPSAPAPVAAASS